MFELLNKRHSKIKLNGTQFRKEIATFGKYRHPNPLFTEDEDNDWDFDEEYADLLIKNFNDGVVESVKLLDIHNEDFGKKLGAVLELKKTDRGVTALIEVEDKATLKDIETMGGDGKTLAHGISTGIDIAFPNANAKKKGATITGPVLRHVALATIPWMQGMSDWEKVEESFDSFSNMAFGHENYTGIPLVHEKDGDEEDGNMKITPALRKSLEILASNSNKTVEEIAESAGIKLKGEEEEEQSGPYSKVLESLASISDMLENKNNEGNKEEDEDEEDDDKSKSSDAVKEAQRIVTSQTKDIKRALAEVTENVIELTKGLTNARTEMDASVVTQRKATAEVAVKELINAGKVLPKDEKQYIELHVANEDMFELITGTLPVQVDFEEVHEDPFQGNPFSGRLNDADVEAETTRYAKMLEPQKAGKYDKIDGRRDE